MNSKHIKKILLYLFTLSLFINCSKDGDSKTSNENKPFKLISLTGDANQLKLTWTPITTSNFIGYKVYRYDSNTDVNINTNTIAGLGVLIFETGDNLTDFFVDNDVPFNSFIHYVVIVEFMSPVNTLESQNTVNYLSFENENLSFSVTSLEKLADGSLRLTWEEDLNTGFEKYSIAAVSWNSLYSSQQVFSMGAVINVNVNQQDNNTIDTNQYKFDKIFYAVSKVINGKIILSKNFLAIENPRSIKFRPSQTLKNPYNDSEMILINPEGEVVFYNKDSQSTTKISTNAYIFFCSIGANDNIDDLYVPTENGKVLIIDLVSHLVKETIIINSDTNYNIVSAIPINGYILFNESLRFTGNGNSMLVYDRVNQNVLNRNGTSSALFNSKLFYGKDNYFFCLYDDGLMYGSESAIRRLNINGNSVTTDLIFNDSKSDSRLFALSDDKSYFVSTNLGYHSDIDYQNFTEITTQKYSQNQTFGDAKIFNNDQIYFTLPYNSQILVYAKNNFNTVVNQYSTSGTPLFIEVFDNQILSINQIENYFYIQTIFK